MSRGSALYESVIEPYTPVLILLTAGLGRLIGFGPVLFRILAGLPLAACALLAVLSARDRTARLGAAFLAPPLLVLWTVYFEGPALWPDPFLAPLLLAAGLELRRFDRTGDARAADRAGLLLGASILVKQTSAWALLAGFLWNLVSSRRRSGRRAVRLFLLGCAPYAAFAALWALGGRTSAHLRWTLLVPLGGHAAEIGERPDFAFLVEAIAPALALPAAWLLSRALAGRRPRISPLAWLAAGAALMTVPRWGLLHLSGATGLLVVLSLDSLRAARRVFSRRFRRASVPALLSAGAGAALLVTHLGVAAIGGGALARDAWRQGVRFWDDARLAAMAVAVSRRVPPGGAFLDYFAASDNIYPLTGTVEPGGLYVNPAFWFFLNKDDLDGRLVSALSRHPETPVLFSEPEAPWAESARRTRLYAFLKQETVAVAPVDDRTSWRAARPGDR